MTNLNGRITRLEGRARQEHHEPPGVRHLRERILPGAQRLARQATDTETREAFADLEDAIRQRIEGRG